MKRRPVAFVLVVLMSAMIVSAPRAAGPAPPPRMLELLQREHHSRQWLYVTVPPERFEFRVRSIDAKGLHGLHARDSKAAAPSTISWDEIARIDQRRSRFGLGMVVGTAIGTVAAGFAGEAIGHAARIERRTPDGRAYYVSGDRSEVGAIAGALIGAAAGAWLGGRIGDRTTSSREWYVAADLPRLALGRSSEAEFVELRSHITPESVVRVRGAFGEFVGRVEHIERDGLAGLQPAPSLDSDLPLPPEPISWDEITRIERRGNSAGRYAAHGGVLLGVAAGSLGAAIVSAFGGGSRDVAGGLFVGAFAGAITGAGLGAMLGASVPRWHVLLKAPATD